MIPIGETSDGRADMTNFEMDLFDTRMHTVKTVKEEDDSCCSGSSARHRLVKPACLPITIVSCLIIALVFLPLFKDEDLQPPLKMTLTPSCKDPCSLTLVESMPEALPYPPSTPAFPATWRVWEKMINETEETLDIAALYWNLSDPDGHESSREGGRILSALLAAGARGVRIRIAQSVNKENASGLYTDSERLRTEAHAEVRGVNMSRLLNGSGGVLHTKFLISDMKRVYVGSANMDWKSLTQVKELGAYLSGCECVATDLYRIFAVYWRLGEEDARIPEKWPISYRTPYNRNATMPLPLIGDQAATLLISSSPPPFNPKGREDDLGAITWLLGRARERVSVAVMDFIPATIYMGERNAFWPALDSALRAAAYSGVEVRLLVSHWNHSKKAAVPFLRSLLAINDGLPKRPHGGRNGSISVRVFTVPPLPGPAIPFTRVNHNKYMVADGWAYIGTSNWSGDYFISTAGVGFALNSTTVSTQLQSVFDRDWTSPYAKDL